MVQETEHDPIDYLPPFCKYPFFSFVFSLFQYDVFLAVRPLTPVESISDTQEIALNDRPITILSTASLPSPNEQTEQILIPRRRPTFQNNEMIYSLYQERLTNNHHHQSSSSPSATTSKRNKRSLTSPSNSLAKKVKQPDLIILD